MNTIESIHPLGGQPVVSPVPKEYGTTVVVLALAALAGLVYYLIQRQTTFSQEAQKIRDSFKNPPKSLSYFDLNWLAQKIESVTVEKMQPNERYKVVIFWGLWRKKFIVSKGEDNAIHVQYIRKTLGQGGFGKVVKLIDLHTGVKTALKVAEIPKEFKHGEMPTEFKGHEEYVKVAYLKLAEEDLKKEHNNLMHVHKPGKKPVGVQDKPLTSVLTITKLYESSSKVRLAFEGSIYEGSLDRLDVEKLPVQIRLYIALQVLLGMKTLFNNNLISHDLKPQNVLFRRVEQKELIIHVSDLGGVTREGDIAEELDKGLAHTPGFGNSEMIDLAASIPFGILKKKLVRDSEKGTIGFTICWILTGRLPEDINSIDEICKEAGLSGNVYKDLLKAIKKVFEGGLIAWLFKDNVKALRREVRKTLKEVSKKVPQ